MKDCIIDLRLGRMVLDEDLAEAVLVFGGQEVVVDVLLANPDAVPRDVPADLCGADPQVFLRAAREAVRSGRWPICGEYVRFLRGECGDEALTSLLGVDGPIDEAKLCGMLRPLELHLVDPTDEEPEPLTVDCGLDPQLGPYVLAVTFDSEGSVSGVAVES